MPLTTFERQILDLVNELRPHERLTIIKDQSGKIDKVYVTRSQSLVIAGGYLTIVPTSDKLEKSK